jgi:hypothetical protein
MDNNKSLEELDLFTALLHDVQKRHEAVFDKRALKLTTDKVAARVRDEGKRFLTVALPRLGKAFDKVLASDTLALNSSEVGFECHPDLKGVPHFLGELFAKVLDSDGLPLIRAGWWGQLNTGLTSINIQRTGTQGLFHGCIVREDVRSGHYAPRGALVSAQTHELFRNNLKRHVVRDKTRSYGEGDKAFSVESWYSYEDSEASWREMCQQNLRSWSALHDSIVQSIRDIRLVLYLLYKYELPYTRDQEQRVLLQFEGTEGELNDSTVPAIRQLSDDIARMPTPTRRRRYKPRNRLDLAIEARRLLNGVFQHFEPLDIVPRHGPGAVATRQRLWDKFQWDNVSSKITDRFPLDAYFYASIGAVCDKYREFVKVHDATLPARVVMVPKDSRGPRLISCEPVDFQWIQQGVGRAIVSHVEACPLTKWNVFFTNQTPNGLGAILGSATGKYSTLDLNEASDRVSDVLVQLLFPPHIYDVLTACRSGSTELPDGRVLKLQKYAPMGSALCFPVLALSVWSILTAGAPDADTASRVLVYGDDVIVPTGYAADAIEHLESFGLKINRDKSCTEGIFRESCGVDSILGVNCTPVRFRTVWSSSPTAAAYASWVAYANSMWDRQCFGVYDLIVDRLESVYGPIPSSDMVPKGSCPTLPEATKLTSKIRIRTNKALQKREYRVRCVSTKLLTKEIDGWSMLLRYFTEAGGRGSVQEPWVSGLLVQEALGIIPDLPAFSVRQYTPRDASILVYRWR